MALTLYEAAQASQNPLQRGVNMAIATTDELLSQLMFVPKSGESFSYTREKDLGGEFDFIAPNGTVAESSASTEKVTVPMRIMAENVDVTDFAEQQQSEFNEQRALQLRLKLKKLGRTMGQKLITGSYASSVAVSAAIAGITAYEAGPNQDSSRHGMGAIQFTAPDQFRYKSPADTRYGAAVTVGAPGTFVLKSNNVSETMTITRTAALPAANLEVLVRITSSTQEWDGLLRLCGGDVATGAGRTIEATGATGDPLTLELMDRMIDEFVKVRERRVFVMPPQLKSKFYALVRAIPGARETVTTLPGVNGPVPTYRGIPILQSEWIPVNEAKGASGAVLTSMFLISLDPTLGLWMGAGQKAGSNTLDIDPSKARALGVSVKEIGPLEDKDAHRTRVTFYGAAALGSQLGVIRARHLRR